MIFIGPWSGQRTNTEYLVTLPTSASNMCSMYVCKVCAVQFYLYSIFYIPISKWTCKEPQKSLGSRQSFPAQNETFYVPSYCLVSWNVKRKLSPTQYNQIRCSGQITITTLTKKEGKRRPKYEQTKTKLSVILVLLFPNRLNNKHTKSCTSTVLSNNILLEKVCKH